MASEVERWDYGEFAFPVGGLVGNPFADVEFVAEFRHRHRTVKVDGFYDGDGVFKVRFMPDMDGPWTFVTYSNVDALHGQRGELVCVLPAGDNHGPVRVSHRTHFAYADGAPYRPVGTTCYVWNHQGDELEAQTLLGGVETWEDAKRCAELFRRHADRIEGILVSLPNFGDEKGVADAIRLSGLRVPVLIQAYPDDLGALSVERRRDAFCGKVSVCNNLRQYRLPFSLTDRHTVHPLSPAFRADLERFLGVCRVVKGLRNVRLGAIGARPNAFNTVRYSEKILEAYGISVQTIDLRSERNHSRFAHVAAGASLSRGPQEGRLGGCAVVCDGARDRGPASGGDRRGLHRPLFHQVAACCRGRGVGL